MLRGLPRSSPVVRYALMVALLGLAQIARADLVLTEDGHYVHPPAAERLLGSVYRDEAVSHDLPVGFSVRLPAKVRIFQRSGLELMSFVQDDQKWGGTVEMITFTADDPAHPRPSDINDFIKRRPSMLPPKLHAQQVISTQAAKIGDWPAARLTMALEATNDNGGKLALMQQELAVQVDPNQYLVLTMYSPLNAKDDAVATFDAMATTLQVTSKKTIVDRRVAAAKAGADWLEDITPEDAAKHLIDQPQLFRILVDGSDVGFLQFEESVSKVSGINGLQVLVTSRTFPDDGSVVTAQTQTFWAFIKQDKGAALPPELQQMATWKRTVVSSLTVGQASETKGTLEEGILTHAGGTYKLDVTRNASNSRGEAIPDAARTPFHFMIGVGTNTPVKPETPRLLPKVLEYLWPRMVDLTKPHQMAFAVYNSPVNKLSLRTVTIGEPEQVIIGKTTYNCVRLEDDLDPGSTTMWALADGPVPGRIIAMRTSDGTILIPTTQDKMQRIWKSRLDQANGQAAGSHPLQTRGHR